MVNELLLEPCLWQPLWYNELHAFLKLNFSQNLLPFECHSAFQPALQDTTKSELDGELESELEVWLDGRLKGLDGRLF